MDTIYRPINSAHESGSIFEKILRVKVREEKEIKMHHFPIALHWLQHRLDPEFLAVPSPQLHVRCARK